MAHTINLYIKNGSMNIGGISCSWLKNVSTCGCCDRVLLSTAGLILPDPNLLITAQVEVVDQLLLDVPNVIREVTTQIAIVNAAHPGLLVRIYLPDSGPLKSSHLLACLVRMPGVSVGYGNNGLISINTSMRQIGDEAKFYYSGVAPTASNRMNVIIQSFQFLAARARIVCRQQLRRLE
jgi:hypothetical protein